MADDEARRVYERFRSVFGSHPSRDERRRDERATVGGAPFTPGRDPNGIADVLAALTSTMGWDSSLAQSDLISSWQEIVGAETAAHSVPEAITDGILVVKCDSTAWATQLGLMRSQITTVIAQRFPGAGITSIRFRGPDAPSWKRGPRAIPGRGPRDTYG